MQFSFLSIISENKSKLKLVNTMDKIIKKLKEEFKNSSDLIVKKINDINIVFLESLASSDKINDYILKVIALSNKKGKTDLNSLIVGPNTVKINKYDEIEFYLTNGFTIVLGKSQALAIETKASINRSVSTPDSQPSIYGPKDAFSENIQMNLGLIKRRIKSDKLVNEDFFIGRKSNTKVSLLYLSDIALEETVALVKEKLKKIDIDGIVDSGNINQLITSDVKSAFPTVKTTERPDYVATNLLEGRIALLIDTSPFILILPVFFADYINPQVDSYNKSININFLKVLRFVCLIMTLITPALYVAIINYNPEAIPLKLLINFATQRDGVPFPSALEVIFMLLICELLRESDLRFPSSYGSSISILGALILGESAVSAGIVSPIMIIVTALTFITSLIFTEQEFVNSLRHARFLFLLSASFFGLYGIVVAGVLFLTHLASIKSFGKPYTYPLAPYDKKFFRKILFQDKKARERYRSRMLTNKNFISQGENK